MNNLTKYSPAILNNNGNLEASMCVTNIGEYVKLSDIKELLNSSQNTPCYCDELAKTICYCDELAGTIRRVVRCQKCGKVWLE